MEEREPGEALRPRRGLPGVSWRSATVQFSVNRTNSTTTSHA